MNHIDYMKKVINNLEGDLLVVGLGDVPRSFAYDLVLNGVDIYNGILLEKSITKTYDILFMSRVAEHFLPQEHTDTWRKIENLSKTVISVFPNMRITHQILKSAIEFDLKNNAMSFKTLRAIFEIFSETSFYDPNDRSLHRIYYSDTTFKNQDFLNYVMNIPHEIKNTKEIVLNGYPHVEVKLTKQNIDYNRCHIDRIQHKKATIRVVFSNGIYETEPITNTEQAVKFLETISDFKDIRCLELKNIVSTINPREIDYIFFLVDSLFDVDTNITITDIDKDKYFTLIEEAISNNSPEFWDINNILFSTPYYCSRKFIKLLLKQEYFSKRRQNISIILY